MAVADEIEIEGFRNGAGPLVLKPRFTAGQPYKFIISSPKFRSD